MFVAYPFAGDAIYVRCGCPVIAVARKMIGTHRIKDDENNII
jgi:hypothetical protein